MWNKRALSSFFYSYCQILKLISKNLKGLLAKTASSLVFSAATSMGGGFRGDRIRNGGSFDGWGGSYGGEIDIPRPCTLNPRFDILRPING